jgi:hypothetical protein
MAVTARRLDSRHPSQYPEAHGQSVPRARLDSFWWRWAACLPSRAVRPASQPASPGSPAERVSARPGRPPDPQRRRPSPHAQPGILHRATTSTRVPIPNQARASATGGCGTGQHVGRRLNATRTHPTARGALTARVPWGTDADGASRTAARLLPWGTDLGLTACVPWGTDSDGALLNAVRSPTARVVLVSAAAPSGGGAGLGRDRYLGGRCGAVEEAWLSVGRRPASLGVGWAPWAC